MSDKIYVISGLGADETVFVKLDLPGYELVHIHWEPVAKGESLNEYAQRLLPQITTNNPLVIGLSLGGMLAVEVSRLIPVKKVISISSVTQVSELPVLYKWAGWLRLEKILPVHWVAKGNHFTQWLFGVTAKDDREILNEVLRKMDRSFLYWALHAVLTWNNESLPAPVWRIHGTSDKVLPRSKKATYDVLIKGGSHLMLLDQHENVSRAILNALNEPEKGES